MNAVTKSRKKPGLPGKTLSDLGCGTKERLAEPVSSPTQIPALVGPLLVNAQHYSIKSAIGRQVCKSLRTGGISPQRLDHGTGTF
jgi:hypothetical protein